jgi:NitT/TauT family transport system ATP-binding protein
VLTLSNAVPPAVITGGDALSSPRPQRAGAVSITLDKVDKKYPTGVQALDPISLQIAGGEFISIVGPSGCGKSTLLRIVAGLVAPSSGACQRPDNATAAFVFQEAALLPWRNVTRNAELLMELEHYPLEERRVRAAEALKLVGIEGFEKLYPHQLSGGMRMRLSLARALALRPDLMLLDEPLAAVDELTRDILQEELSSLWQSAGFTGLLVTHNVHEAVFLSNRVVIMSPRPGRVLGVLDIPFAFPRQRELRSTAEFAMLTGQVSAALRQRQVEITE